MRIKIKKLNLIREEKEVPAFIGFIHHESFSELEKKFDAILINNELRYYTGLAFEKRKKDYLTGCFIAKSAAGAYLNEPDLKKIEISNGAFNQPYVKYLGLDIPGVSLSHSSNYSVALSFPRGHIMGIDIEENDPRQLEVIKSQLTEFEINFVYDNKLKELDTFFQIWSMKEALSKALKCGLTTPFPILEISNPEIINDTLSLCYFKNFGQYKCYSWSKNGYSLSIILPKKTDLKVDIDELFI